MRVKWFPPYTKTTAEGDVVHISTIKDKEHFLIVEDDGQVRSVPAEECVVIKPKIIPDAE